MLLFTLLSTPPAYSGVSTCGAGEAPSTFVGESCRSICSIFKGELTCTPENECDVGSGVAYHVVEFDSGKVSAFGTCQIDMDIANFCCVTDTTDTITRVTALGTPEVDKVFFSYPPSSPTVNLEPTASSMSGWMRTGDHDDQLVGSNFAGAGYTETLNGEDGEDFITGLAGDDTLMGGRHDDTLVGGTGSDTLHGELGVDTLHGDIAGDSVTGQDDVLFGGAGDDFLHGGGGEDQLHGQNGDDQLWGDEDDDTLFGERHADILRGGKHADTLVGGNGADTLLGQAGADRLHGGYGDDILEGGGGMDTLYGSRGNDTMEGGPNPDVLCERRAYWPDPSQPYVCDDWNYFAGDGSTGDVAYTELDIDGGFNSSLYCAATTDFLGNGTVESAGLPHPDRDWGTVLDIAGITTNDPEPQTCTDLRSEFGN
jgi:hypothetical protein